MTTKATKGRQKLPVNPTEMTEAAKMARRQYMKTYRATHKDSIRRWNAKYWEKKAAASAETEIAED